MDDDGFAILHVGVIARDPDALAAFEAVMRPIVRGMLRARGMSDDDADEVWNDAFLAAVDNAATVGPVGIGLRRLTLAVVHRRWVDHVRRAVRHPTTHLDPDWPADRQHGSSPDPDVLRMLRGCMDRLKPMHAAVIEMTSRGLSAAEVSAVLEISTANAAKIRQRARGQLAECLGGKPSDR